MSDDVKIAVIGGSGLYDIDGIEISKEKEIKTPYGISGKYVIGNMHGMKIVFLPRHGKGHTLLPSEINYKANIFGLKMLGVNRIISVGAVGSLKDDIRPTHLVVPDQFYDHTKQRQMTFFGEGIAAHVALANPVCGNMLNLIYSKAKDLAKDVHKGGTYINMEGPAFSTRAESELYRKWGFDVIGMTNMIEARLAREAEICYATIAVVTDYDCWHTEHDSVTVDTIIKYLNQGMGHVKDLLKAVLPEIKTDYECGCNIALKDAIVTQREHVSDKVLNKLEPIIGKYF